VTAAGRDEALARIRAVCLALPEVTERPSHGAPTFFIRGKRSFAMVFDDHHGDGRFAIWCAAPDGMQQLLVEGAPERFFVPPYVGHRGWLGVYLDVPQEWDELAELVTDAWRTVAPKRLAAQLDPPPTDPPP
jgi:hypothetical protein